MLNAWFLVFCGLVVGSDGSDAHDHVTLCNRDMVVNFIVQAGDAEIKTLEDDIRLDL